MPEYKYGPNGREEITGAELEALIASRVKTLPVRKAEIEERTQELLQQGLEYPADSGIMHSLTEERLSVYNAAKARQEGLSYPRRFKSSNGHILSLASEEAFVAFDNALTVRYLQIMEGELDLLEALYNAETQEELDAIEDNR